MGAYLSSPVTGKELYEGGKEGYLEYGGASMQVGVLPGFLQNSPLLLGSCAKMLLNAASVPASFLTTAASAAQSKGRRAPAGMAKDHGRCAHCGGGPGGQPDAAMFGVFDGHGGRCGSGGARKLRMGLLWGNFPPVACSEHAA